VAVTGESVSLVVITAKLFHKELDNLWVGHEALQARVHEARVAKILQTGHSRNTGNVYTLNHHIGVMHVSKQLLDFS